MTLFLIDMCDPNLRNVWIAVRDKLEVKLVAEKLPGIKLTAKIQTVPINASVKID